MGDQSGAVLPSTRAHVDANLGFSNAMPFPATDLVTFALSNIEAHDPKRAVYADAANPNNRILFGEVKLKIEQVAAGLKAKGLNPGDCVCIHSYNSIWYPLCWLAVIAAGGIVTGSNPASTSNELIHHFKTTQTRFVVAQESVLAAVKEAVSKCDISIHHVLILGANDVIKEHGLVRWKALPFQHRSNWISFDDDKKQDATIAVYATTSGTTGLPKAAELSHRYVVTQAALIEHAFGKETEQIRQLICLPVFHAFAAQLSIILPLRLGITTYFMPRFHERDYVNHVYQLKITHSPVVPPIVTSLINAIPAHLDSLRYLICAGAPMTASVQNRLCTMLNPAATVAQCWGATETGWITVFSRSERDHSGSVGRALPGTCIKIVDRHGNAVTSANEAGEARVLSNSMFKRYRHNPNANASAFDDQGFYCTGDIACMDDTGRIFITGRVKDTIKVNGWQVSPEEIENIVLKLDRDVADCAVTGFTFINDAGLEQTKPRAFIVRKPDSKITSVAVSQHVNDNVVGYKRLTGGVIFVDKIPRSSTGKILRRMLTNEEAVKVYDMYMEKEIGNVYESGTESLSRYIATTVIVPLCLALGLPGLVLLAVGFRLVVQARNHSD